MGAGVPAHHLTEDQLRAAYPGLESDARFRIASDPDLGYNCFAWAAEDTEHRWEAAAELLMPTRAGTYWPPGVTVFPTLNAYIEAYRSLGYELCDTAELEEGFEKIAIYVGASGEPFHAARQLASGVWTSKLGGANDIEHETPDGITSLNLGSPSIFLRRRIVRAEHEPASPETH